MITVDEARARGVALPADDDVAQNIVDEQEAWLRSEIGPLDGERTETFYVGIGGTCGKLALHRSTDLVVVTDSGATIDSDLIRLINAGSAIERLDVAGGVPWWWVGPYVSVTYTPNDEDLVRAALFDLLALKVQPVSGYTSETIGAYSYSRGSVGSPVQARAIIVSSILPKRDPLYRVAVSRQLGFGDPVINRAEAPL